MFDSAYLYHFASHLSRDHMAVSKVPYSKHQAHFAVALGDDYAAAEHQSLCPFVWLGHFHEHAPDQKGIHNGAKQGLEQEEEDALGAFLGDVSEAVTNGGFCFYEEKKSGWKVVDIGHTRSVVLTVGLIYVSTDVGYDPPH